MRYKLFIPFIAIIMLVASPVILGQSTEKSMQELETVKFVDLKKYVGMWYEIEKIPNRFQDQCDKNTTATYALLPDGSISVINRCTEADGSEDSAEGLARVVDTTSNSKLEVSFVSLFGWHLFWGDYWIIGLEENYQYVVVGTPSRKYGWILSRQPSMSESQLEQAHDILRRQGYDPDMFVLSKQTQETEQ